MTIMVIQGPQEVQQHSTVLNVATACSMGTAACGPIQVFYGKLCLSRCLAPTMGHHPQCLSFVAGV